MNGPTEPSSDLRQLANTLRQTYLALIQEGFTAQESLGIIGQIITAQIAAQNGGDEA